MKEKGQWMTGMSQSSSTMWKWYDQSFLTPFTVYVCIRKEEVDLLV